MARPLSTEARTRALDAAADLLDEGGLELFSVEAVARRSGVAKTTIYRHWDSGNALLMDALDCRIQPFPTPNTGSLADDLRTFLAGILDAMGLDKKLLMLGILQAAATDPEIGRIQQQMAAERMQPLKTIIQLAQGRGEIHPDLDLDLAVSFVDGPLFHRTMLYPEPPGPVELDQLVDLTVAGLTGWEPI